MASTVLSNLSLFATSRTHKDFPHAPSLGKASAKASLHWLLPYTSSYVSDNRSPHLTRCFMLCWYYRTRARPSMVSSRDFAAIRYVLRTTVNSHMADKPKESGLQHQLNVYGSHGIYIKDLFVPITLSKFNYLSKLSRTIKISNIIRSSYHNSIKNLWVLRTKALPLEHYDIYRDGVLTFL
ncbi:hypothetical protein HD806DRAFT_477937 [Xylariaceae sp. AK1471]|nr:hypothetical protein HD806DRAFT_477937 [Xylariaceae sp. AK1471]